VRIVAAGLVGFVLLGCTTAAAGSDRSARGGGVRGAIVGPSEWQLAQAEPLAVSFVSKRRGFLATVGGRLLATGDGGRSWRRVGPRFRFRKLDFLSAQDGYALTKSGVLLQTVDGGRAWSRLHVFAGFPQQGLSAGTLEFVDRQHGFVASADARIYRSDDGGRTWSRLPFGCSSVFFAFGGVAFAGPSRGYAICGSQPATVMQTKELFTTADGGHHWRLLSRTGKRRTGLPWTGYADALAFPAANVGYLSADRAGIYRTHDGGRSWQTVLFSDDTYAVRDASWIDANTGYVLLFSSGLARTDDGGGHWRQLYPAPPGLPQGPVSFSSATQGIGVGTRGLLGSPGAIVASSDAGRSWQELGSLPKAASQQLVRSSASTLWAVATSPTYANGDVRIFRSADRGRNWRLAKTLAGAHYAFLSFPSSSVGFLAAGNGRLYRSHDGGRSWSVLVNRVSGVSGLGFLTPQVGFALIGPPGTAPALMATRDGGASWQASGPNRTDLRFISLTTLGPRDAWLTASACASGPTCTGRLLHTSDAGRSWQSIRLPSVFGQGGLDFVTPTIGYANDSQRGLYRTRDGGRTWTFVRGPYPAQ
jgi:photosystem II stability/assembly factor-like uncharacterized protein